MQPVFARGMIVSNKSLTHPICLLAWQCANPNPLDYRSNVVYLPHIDTLTLLPESAVWHAPTRTLVVADVHLGKAAAFRAGGIAVPDGDDAHDLRRLAHLVEQYGAARLVIAGDLFHAPTGMSPVVLANLETFLASISIPIILALGNHDTRIRNLPTDITVVPHLDLDVDGPRVIHDPAGATSSHFHIAGHLHPVVRLKEGRRPRLRLPCFWKQPNLLILPSFGSFTGGSIITPAADDRIFTALRNQVIEIPRAAWS